MTFSKTALLTSLTCFTLGMSSLQGDNLCVNNTGDEGSSSCFVYGECYQGVCPSINSTLGECIADWNRNPSSYDGISFVVPDTFELGRDVPNLDSPTYLKIDSKYPGGTILSSDRDSTVMDAIGDGVYVEWGPEGSELISMGDGGNNDPAAMRAVSRAEIIFGPQFVYPLTNSHVNAHDNPESFEFIFKDYGAYRFTHTGTQGMLWNFHDGDPGRVFLDPDVVVTGNVNFYLNAGHGSRLILQGSGHSSQLISLQTDDDLFIIDHVDINDSTFGMSVNPRGSGTIGMYSGVLQFTTSFELTIDHDMVFYEDGTIEVPSGVVATLSNGMGGGGLFTKSGGGILELRGTSSQSGGISIQNGTLSLDQADRITGSQIEIISPGILQLTQSMSLSNRLVTAGGAITLLNGSQGTFDGDLSGSSSFSISDGSTDEPAIFSYSGNGSGFSGGLTFTNVEFDVRSNNATSKDMDITLESGASLTLNDRDISIRSLVGTDAEVRLGSGSLSMYQTAASANIDAAISGEGGSLHFYSADGNNVSVTLEGGNTFTGGVTIGSFVSLEITDADNMGASTSIRIEDEGTFRVLESNNSVTLAQGFEFISGTGRITLDTDSTTLEIGGAVTGSGNLYLSGEGSGSTLTLGNVADSYSGEVTMDDSKLIIQSGVTPSLVFLNGTLKVEADTTLDGSGTIYMGDGGGNFSVDPDVKLSILGVISGTNSATFSGGGTTLLSGINTYTGDTIIENGTVQISSDENLGADGETLVFRGTGAIPSLQVLETMSSSRSMKIQEDGGGINVDAGKTATFTGSVSIRSGPPAFIKSGEGDLVILLGSPTSLPQLTTSITGGDFTSNMNLLENSSINISSGATFTVEEDTAAFYYGANDDKTISGEGSFIKTGEGVLNFLVPLTVDHSQLINTYQGGTNLKAGVLAISVDRALGEPSATLTMNGGSLRAVIVDGASVNKISSTRPVVLNVDSTFDTMCNTVSPCSIESPCCPTLELSGLVSGSGGVTKTSNGTLSLLNTANTFSGPTRIEGGTLRIAAPSSLGTSSSITFLGTTLEIGGDGTLTQSMVIESTGAAFSVDSGVTTTISGVISGSGTVTYSGMGTVLPTAINTYTGNTILTKGLVQITSDANLGSIGGGNIVFNGKGTAPTLQVSSSFTSERNVEITGAGGGIKVDSNVTSTLNGDVLINSASPPYPFTKSGLGELIMLPSTASTTPKLTLMVTEGTMKGNMNFLQKSSMALSSGTVMTIQSDVDASYDGADDGSAISGGGALTISGEGELTFLVPASGETQRFNSYAGDTSLSGGILTISADYESDTSGVLGTSASSLIVSGGALKTVVTGDADNAIIVNRDITLNSDTTFNVTCSSDVLYCSSLTLNGVVSGSGGINKIGKGTLKLLGVANTFSGAISIEESTLRITSSDSLGSAPSITFDAATLGVAETTTLTQSMVVEIDGGGFAIDAEKVLTISGVISGEGGVTYSGAGTTMPTATNTYEGNTTLTNGLVQISSDANFGVTTSGGTLGSSVGGIVFDGLGVTPNLQITEDITSIRGIVIGGGGANITVDTDVSASYTGNVVIGTEGPYTFIKSGEGDLSILPSFPALIPQLAVDVQDGNMTGNMNFLRNSSIQIAQGSIVTLNTEESALYFGGGVGKTISGNGSIVITGTSELAFLVPLAGGKQLYNSYTGSTRLVEGILTISADYKSSTEGVLGNSAAPLIGAGGTLKTVVLPEETSNLVISERAVILASDTDTTFNTDCNGVGGLTFCSTLQLNGDITGGGGLIKTGGGTLVLAGDNDYLGGTTISDGRLVVTGVIQGIIVLGDAALRGNGTVGNTSVFGGLAAGASIGTLTIDGDLTLETGSTFYQELSSTEASLVDVTGDATISEGVSLLAVPTPGVYTAPVSYVALSSLTSLSGTFSSATAPAAFFMIVDTAYTATEASITVTPAQVSPDNAGNNADAVANALNRVVAWNRLNVTLNIPNIYTGTDVKLPTLLESLFPINNTEELGLALDQMHPAALKGVVIAQENASVQVQETLSTRLNEDLETLDCTRQKESYTFWINGMGSATNQDSNNYDGSPQAGYNNTMAGFVAGADYRLLDSLYAGALGGYTSSYVSFDKNRGSGNVHTGYFGLYLAGTGKLFYGSASLTGGWSGYRANRHIEYTSVNVTAKNSHGGKQLMSHVEGGVNIPVRKVNIRPFNRLDYLSQQEYGYSEKDAGDWNLSVAKNTSILIRNELGLQFASCFQVKTGKITLSPKVSWVREMRVKGSKYDATFADAPNVPFRVTGYFPDRSLFSTGGVITGALLDDTLSLSAYYDGEFTGGYSAHRYGGEVRYSF